MIDHEKQARHDAHVTPVDENGTLGELIAMALQDEIRDRANERMRGMDQARDRRVRAIGETHVPLVKSDTLITWCHRLRPALVETCKLQRMLADFNGDVCDLESSRLARSHDAAEFVESSLEESVNEVRLELAGLCLLHVVTHGEEARLVHHLFA